MGHSSVKVTETYFRRHSDDKIWDMNKEILSYIFDKQWFVFAWIKNIKSINVLIILQMLSVTL